MRNNKVFHIYNVATSHLEVHKLFKWMSFSQIALLAMGASLWTLTLIQNVQYLILNCDGKGPHIFITLDE